MRIKNISAWLALVLAFSLTAAGCANNEQTGEGNTQNQASTENGEDTSGKAMLKLQGDSGTKFSGSCTVGNQEPEEISGQVPEIYSFELKGEPLDCKINSDGDAQVDLAVGKNVRSVQRISGGTLHLTYKNGSISSSASSSGSSNQGSSSSSQGGSVNEPSGVISESRNVSGFKEVELNGAGTLSIQQTGDESLSIEAEEDVIPKINTEVVNNRLIIGPKPNTTINTTKPINYNLTVNNLDTLKVEGAGNVEAQDISTDQLAITISGAGDVKMAGRANSQNVEILGSGDYQAGELQSKNTKIHVAGSGSALVKVSEELDAEVSGSGSVEYIGSPTVNKDVSGAGEVKKH
ncbi:MAG: DUF2807 domain-containing protein [Rubrobacter sp.]|nr:DUF2807 domain-containing protein [Rubrobacter sp.]